MPDKSDQQEINALYQKAIRCLRNKVENEDMELDDALNETLSECTLGLNQIAQLEREAKKKYG